MLLATSASSAAAHAKHVRCFGTYHPETTHTSLLYSMTMVYYNHPQFVTVGFELLFSAVQVS